jgi:hypothetical protein
MEIKMKSAVLFVLLLAPAFGQAPSTPAPPPMVLRVFQIKNADVKRLAAMVDIFGARVRPDPSLRVIAVSGPQEQVKAIEDAIQRYDVPPPPQKNVDLTFHLLQALPAAVQDNLPADREPVIKPLRTPFTFQGYRLADTIQVRARDEDGFDASSAANFAGLFPNAPTTSTQLRAQRATVIPSGAVPVIRIDNLRLNVRVPQCTGKNNAGECSQWNFMDNGVNTSVDVREGQKVVIGKTALGADSAVIVVVTAKVVD